MTSKAKFKPVPKKVVSAESKQTEDAVISNVHSVKDEVGTNLPVADSKQPRSNTRGNSSRPRPETQSNRQESRKEQVKSRSSLAELGQTFFGGSAASDLTKTGKNLTKKTQRRENEMEFVESTEEVTNMKMPTKHTRPKEKLGSFTVDSMTDTRIEDEIEEQKQLSPGKSSTWPPSDYAPLAPLELPIGPGAEARKYLENRPIFADEANATAIARENESAMFMIQLPSDLQMPRHRRKKENLKEVELPTEETFSMGKIQVMKSGKVYLIGNDNKRYLVSAGSTCSFSQYLTSIEVEEATNQYMNDLTDSYQGDIHMLGSVNRKLVVIPQFDIGSNRRKEKLVSEQESSNSLDNVQDYSFDNSVLIEEDE